jgi:hypothetical protein
MSTVRYDIRYDNQRFASLLCINSRVWGMGSALDASMFHLERDAYNARDADE